jgi:hypothetical protein
LGIASFFKRTYTAHASRPTIRNEFWDRSGDDSNGPDPPDNFLQNDVLFDRAIALLVKHGMLEVIPDEFAPPIYVMTEQFDKRWEELAKDRGLPFFKYELDRDNKDIWLRMGLESINKQYGELGMRESFFEKPDIDWEPLPLDRDDPSLHALMQQLDETIELVRSDNGYSANVPEEKELVLDSLSSASKKLKTSQYISWRYIQKNILEPTRTLLRRFKNAAIGIAAAGIRSALETWIKNNAMELLNHLTKWPF